MKPLLITTLILLSGCSLFKRPCSNIERLAKKFPECFDELKKDVSLDTTLPEIKIQIEKEFVIDSAANDSIMALLDSCQNMTSQEKTIYVNKIKTIFLNNLNIEATDTTFDNLNIKLWVENGKLMTKFTRLATPITVTGETDVLQPKPQGFNWNLLWWLILIPILWILYKATKGINPYEILRPKKDD